MWSNESRERGRDRKRGEETGRESSLVITSRTVGSGEEKVRQMPFKLVPGRSKVLMRSRGESRGC